MKQLRAVLKGVVKRFQVVGKTGEVLQKCLSIFTSTRATSCFHTCIPGLSFPRHFPVEMHVWEGTNDTHCVARSLVQNLCEVWFLKPSQTAKPNSSAFSSLLLCFTCEPRSLRTLLRPDSVEIPQQGSFKRTSGKVVKYQTNIIR